MSKAKYISKLVDASGATTSANVSYTGTLTGGTGIVAIGTSQIYKDASGNVGIGTTTPTNKLTVNGGIDFTGSAFSGSGTGIWQQATNKLGFVTAGSTRCTIDATGNVGIGTTNPATLLHLGQGQAVIRFGATSTGYDIGRDNSSGNFIQNATQASPYNAFIWQQAGAERMRIDSSGNVGIGTTAPTRKISIGGTATIGVGYIYTGTNTEVAGNFVDTNTGEIKNFGYTNYYQTFYTNNTEKLRIDTSGNVGIGTSSPSQKLVIAGGAGEWRFKPDDITVGSNNETYGTTYSGGLPASTASTAGGGKIFLGGNARGDNLVSAVAFYRGNTESMRIDSSGLLLINTTANTASTFSPRVQINAGSNSVTTIQGMPCGLLINNTYNGATTGQGISMKFQMSSAEAGKYAAIAGVGDGSYSNSMALAFYTTANAANGVDNVTERMRIDSSGRVTMPYQPRFMAYRSGHQTGYTGGNAVIFNNAATNVGNHYNTTTGLFTAPVAGNYIFEVGIYMSAAIVQIWPLVNGGRAESIIVTLGADVNLTATTVRYLNANDTYCLVPYANYTAGLTVYDNGVHTYFRGSLIG
jgi:hypothetical protein